MLRVVLVRPWTHAHGGTGCCTGEPRDGVCLDQRVGGGQPHDPGVHAVAATYRLLSDLDDVDVQIVSAGNTAYLLPTVFRAVRRRAGTLAAVRAAARSTTAGAVLVDGERVGDISTLGPDGVLGQVRVRSDASRAAAQRPRTSNAPLAPRSASTIECDKNG